MNQFQKRHHRQASRLAAAGYIPAADCIGKTFVFGSCHYEVIAHNPERATFTLSIINHGNSHIERDETFVRHHCTPAEPREIQSCRYDRPRYSLFPAFTISDKTQLGDSVNQPADAVGDKMLETEAVIELAAEIEATTEPLDPAHYLDQEFNWSSPSGTSYIFRVQAYHAGRKAFRLYVVNGTTGSFYRDESFVYEHCQPAAAPVIRETLPRIQFDPRRYWNLVSLADKRKYIAEHVQATGQPMPDPLHTCGCCGQRLYIIGTQTFPAKYNLKDLILVDCRNEDCIVYRRTASTESHHETCEIAKCEALKKEQVQYAHARSQYWLERVSSFRQRGREQTKSARAAQRKSTYWLNQLNKLEASANGRP